MSKFIYKYCALTPATRLIEYSGSVNPRIRATVANVVRNVQTPESEKLLLDMLKDKENIVKMQAVNTLGMYALKEEHLEQIRKNLKDDILGPDQYYYVLGVLKKYEKSNSQVVQKSLEEMARRPMHADLHSPAVVTTQAREPGHQYA